MGAGQLAEGGPVRGPGTSTSDSIPARLSAGEFVVNAAATRKNRRLLDLLNAGGSVRHLAKGGPANPSPIMAPSIPKATAGTGGGAGGSVVTIAPVLNLTASGGTPEANDDLAARVGQELEGAIQGMVGEALRQQLRPGGMLRR